MVYFKVSKSSAYFSRYQVKYRRRRAGKTDYRARLRLTTQDKNKYNTPRYRFVVRFTKRDIVCQIAYASVAGDVVVAAAYAHELPRYGLDVGLTNYAAAYCVGLLLARRVLTKFGLADKYQGLTEASGEDYNVEEMEDGPRPFTALLDTGLKRTSTGSKVFAALKGGLDGGLNIPHSEKRFVGYSEKKLDADTLRKHIYGGHVAAPIKHNGMPTMLYFGRRKCLMDTIFPTLRHTAHPYKALSQYFTLNQYMEEMKEEEPEKYQTHFARFLKGGLEPEDLEDKYKEVHEAIREDPMSEKKERHKPDGTKRWKAVRLTYDERKEALKARLAEMTAADEDDE